MSGHMCECGNKATMKKRGHWKCDRCYRIECWMAKEQWREHAAHHYERHADGTRTREERPAVEPYSVRIPEDTRMADNILRMVYA